MTPEIPFVFFDNRNYLEPYFLTILKKISIDQTTYVLTNALRPESLNKKTNLHFVALESLDYEKQFSIFERKYVHLSTNSRGFELACFERFFALEALLVRLEIENVWHLDTDILPAPSLHEFDKYELVFSSEYLDSSVVSAHTSKFSKSRLTDLTRFMTYHLYDDYLSEMRELFADRMQSGLLGGVCDMRAIGYWLKSNADIKWRNSYGSQESGYFINDTLGTLDLECNRRRRSNKFFILKKTRIGFNFWQIGSKKVFATLHFPGHYKSLIPIIDRTSFLIGNIEFIRVSIRIFAKIKLVLHR